MRQHQPPCDALMHDCVNSKPLPSLLILFILQALNQGSAGPCITHVLAAL